MNGSINITLREALLGSTADLLAACGLAPNLSSQALIDIIVGLSRCQEEGVALSPEVYLCRQLGPILSMIPHSESIQIGHTQDRDTFISEALKKCAPLARHGWHIYSELGTNRISFGVFRGPLGPLSISVPDTLFAGKAGKEGPSIVRLYRKAQDCIEIRTSRSGVCNVFLSHAKADIADPRDALELLVKKVCERVPSDYYRDTITNVTKTALLRGLSNAHGTLVAVVKGRSIPSLFGDRIAFPEQIDLAGLVREVSMHPDEPWRVERLEGACSLLGGMLSCDGIVILSRHASLLGYNSFVQVNSADRSVNGGARKRAYLSLCKAVPRLLTAVFMMSQDGNTYIRS